MSRLALNLGRASAGANVQSDAVHALGLNTQALLAMPTDERLGALANAFQRIPDGAIKAEIAMQLFGRAGMNMIPVLNQGAAGHQAHDDSLAHPAVLGRPPQREDL